MNVRVNVRKSWLQRSRRPKTAEGRRRVGREDRGHAGFAAHEAVTPLPAESASFAAPSSLPADSDRPLERHPDLRNPLNLLDRKVQLRALTTHESPVNTGLFLLDLDLNCTNRWS
jgi:hypothetical protein